MYNNSFRGLRFLNRDVISYLDYYFTIFVFVKFFDSDATIHLRYNLHILLNRCINLATYGILRRETYEHIGCRVVITCSCRGKGHSGGEIRYAISWVQVRGNAWLDLEGL